MDALVAEKVMGNKLEYGCFVDDRYADDCVTDICDCAIAESLHKEKDKFPDKCQYWRELDPLPYSTDIAAAWQVVEQVTKTQCDDTGSFYVFKIVKKHHKWCTYIKHPLWSGIHSELGKNYEMYQAYADTAPLAICRCALKVAGVAEI